jgi:hypothetical protein
MIAEAMESLSLQPAIAGTLRIIDRPVEEHSLGSKIEVGYPKQL